MTPMQELDKNTHDFLAKKLNGKAFVYVGMIMIGKEFSVEKSYYTVKDGIVYSIEKDGELYQSKDTLLSVECECFCIGKYSQAKKYQRVIKSFTYSELKKRLTL